MHDRIGRRQHGDFAVSRKQTTRNTGGPLTTTNQHCAKHDKIFPEGSLCPGCVTESQSAVIGPDDTLAELRNAHTQSGEVVEDTEEVPAPGMKFPHHQHG
jgi:hypothetical protein